MYCCWAFAGMMGIKIMVSRMPKLTNINNIKTFLIVVIFNSGSDTRRQTSGVTQSLNKKIDVSTVSPMTHALCCELLAHRFFEPCDLRIERI
jgi:hypothetical protein